MLTRLCSDFRFLTQHSCSVISTGQNWAQVLCGMEVLKCHVQMWLENSLKIFYDDIVQEKTEQTNRENVNESSIDDHNRNTNDMMRIPDITTEELQTAISKLKKRQICRQQWNQSRRHQSIRRWDDRNAETNLQRNRKAERVYTRGMEENENKNDTQKRRRGRCWKLPPDLFVASVVQFFHDNTVQQIISKTRPNPSGRSGGIQKLSPNNRSSCDVQNDWPEMPRVVNQTVDRDNRLHEGVRLHHPQINLERPQILRYRTWLHQPPEETEQRPESHSIYWRRKWHVSDQEGNQTGRSIVKLALQYGFAESAGRRHSSLAKEKRDGNVPEWQRPWLPRKHEICWRRAPICILKEQLQKLLCELKSSTEKVGLRIHPGKK